MDVEFNNVVLNYGGWWNQASSRFEAPAKGLYVFHLSIMGWSSSTYNRADIYARGSSIQACVAYDSPYSASASVVIQLEVFDEVYVRLIRGSLFNYSSDYNIHFIGYLLVQTP